jgi:hypothetical protein
MANPFTDASDELVTGRGLELSRIYLLGELEEGARILPEIVDVKHCLQTHQDTLIDCTQNTN